MISCASEPGRPGSPPGFRPRLRLILGWGLACLSIAGCQEPQSAVLDLSWTDTSDRPWPGPDVWGNRLQDWGVRGGRLEALASLPMRTAHILTRRGEPEKGDVAVTLDMGLSREPGTLTEDSRAGEQWSGGGLLLGAGGPEMDFRRAALIHHSPGPGGGLFLGVDHEGYLFVADFSAENRVLSRSEATLGATDSVELRILVNRPEEVDSSGTSQNRVDLTLRARSRGSGDAGASLHVSRIESRQVTGGMALVSHGTAEDGVRAWFTRVQMEGEGLEARPGRGLGPILGAQHTLSRGILTLTAQLFPLSPLVPGPARASRDTVLLELREDGEHWVRKGTAPVVTPGFTATFRIDGWSGSRSVPYRLSLLGQPETRRERPEESPSYEGTIRSEPSDRNEYVVAAFTGNHNVASPGVDRGTFDWQRHLWFPHEDIVQHVLSHSPDFLFFSGDQVYEGASPTSADFEHPYEDYLYKWYLWLWAFRDLTSDIPSVAIPDDHDVFHGNVWGAGGKATPPGLTGAEAQDQGGYRLPPDWVNMVQQTQASHLPEPHDPAPLEGGVEVYYTDILYGGVSFAVLEDRKFKSPPKVLLPEADVWNGWAQNPAFDPRSEADAPGASLLGQAQEEFLEEWATDWADGTWMKVVLSQTIFGNVATIPEDAMSGSVIPSLPVPEPGVYVPGDKLAADMDSNGWPPAGRDRALRAMRKGFAVHLAGDQHLASTIQYGVDGFGDGPFALCVPSVANFWPRRWYPPEPGGNREPGSAAYTGDFLDGFGNPMTVFAVSNPAKWGRDPAVLHDRAPGYGIARFDRTTREVSLEAWPRWSDPEAQGSPYPGWPVRFRQEEGFGRAPQGYLPTLAVRGLENPVVQVISEMGGETVYTIRIRGSRFTPRVFRPGTYAVTVGEPGTDAMRTFLGLRPMPDSSRSLEVDFEAPSG